MERPDGRERKLMNRTKKILIAAGVMSYLSLQWLGRTWGSTRAERRRRLPGDEIVSNPSILTTHATTIDAPPSAVWPWLIQMGWHQGGWYRSVGLIECCFQPIGPPPTD
jgi:hypothetical protein